MSIAKVSFFCERFLPFILMAIALFIPISYRVTIYLLDVALITWLLSDGWYKQLKTAFRNRIVFFTAFFVAFASAFTSFTSATSAFTGASAAFGSTLPLM